MMPEVLAEKETDVVPIKVEELLQEQGKTPFCEQPSETAGQPGLQYDQYRYGFLLQKPALNGMLHRVMPRR